MWRWFLLGLSSAVAEEITQVKLVSGECRGREEETGVCEELPSCKPLCERQDCLFQPWSDWYSLRGCIGLCTRHRGILHSNNECGQPCTGAKIETSAHPGCLSPHCVFHPRNCLWSEWSPWSAPQEKRDAATQTEEETGVQPLKSVMLADFASSKRPSLKAELQAQAGGGGETTHASRRA
eukprot:s598_g1.t1